MDAVLTRLHRHQVRREQGIGTVSLLAGPIDAGAEAWRWWLAETGRRAIVCTAAQGPDQARTWTAGLIRARDLAGDALAFLERCGSPGSAPAALRSRLGHGDVRAWRMLHDDLVARGGHPWALTAARLVLANARESGPPGALAEALMAALDGDHAGPQTRPWARAVIGLAMLVQPRQMPGLLLHASPHAPGATPDGWLDQSAGAALTLAAALPGLPLAIAVTEAALARARTAAAGRTGDLLREGLIRIPVRVPAVAPEVTAPDGAPARPPAHLPSSLRRLARDGAGADVRARFLAAARLRAGARTDEERDAARSAAERFLFERLQCLPETAGLFALNQRLDFRFGRARAEIDLLCQPLAIAVEIDGYHHFRDADAYRRDRRKDVLLQQHGYLVLRVLADDVIVRLDEVLDTVLDAVGARKGRKGASP